MNEIWIAFFDADNRARLIEDWPLSVRARYQDIYYRGLGYEEFVAVARYSIIDDHTPFLEVGTPAGDIIDFDYPFWHTSEDTCDKITLESLERVGRMMVKFLTED